MGKLRCPCGNVISNVQWPCPYVGYAVTQTDYDDHSDNSEDGVRELVMGSRSIWECSECGRISFDEPRGEHTVKWYVPEDGKPGHLMRADKATASTSEK